MKSIKIATTAITLSLTVVFVFSSAYAAGPTPYGNTNYKIGPLYQQEWKKPTDEDFLRGANPAITDAERKYGPGGIAPTADEETVITQSDSEYAELEKELNILQNKQGKLIQKLAVTDKKLQQLSTLRDNTQEELNKNRKLKGGFFRRPGLRLKLIRLNKRITNLEDKKAGLTEELNLVEDKITEIENQLEQDYPYYWGGDVLREIEVSTDKVSGTGQVMWTAFTTVKDDKISIKYIATEYILDLTTGVIKIGSEEYHPDILEESGRYVHRVNTMRILVEMFIGMESDELEKAKLQQILGALDHVYSEKKINDLNETETVFVEGAKTNAFVAMDEERISVSYFAPGTAVAIELNRETGEISYLGPEGTKIVLTAEDNPDEYTKVLKTMIDYSDKALNMPTNTPLIEVEREFITNTIVELEGYLSVTEVKVSIGYQTYNVAMDDENITTSSRGLARGPIIKLDRGTAVLFVTYYPWDANAITEVVTKDDPDKYSEFINRAIGWVQSVLDYAPSLTNHERVFLEGVKEELTRYLPDTETTYYWGGIENMEVITIAESSSQGGPVEVKRTVMVENGKLTIVSEILPYTPIPLSFTMDLAKGNIHIVERRASQEEEFTPEDRDGYLHAVEDMIYLVEYQQNKEQELDKKEILQGAIDYLKGIKAQLTPTYYWGGELENISVQITDPQIPRNFVRATVEDDKLYITFGGGTSSYRYNLDLITGFLYYYSFGGNSLYEPTDEGYGDKIASLVGKIKYMMQIFGTIEERDIQPVIDYMGSILKQFWGYYWGDIEDMEVVALFYPPQLEGKQSITRVEVGSNQLTVSYASYQLIDEKLYTDLGIFTLDLITGNIHLETMGPKEIIATVTDISVDEKEQYKWAITSMLKRVKQAFRYERDKYEKRELREIRKYLNNII